MAVMLSNRVIKKVFYALVALVGLAGIFVLLVLAVLRAQAPSQPAATPVPVSEFKPISLEGVAVIPQVPTAAGEKVVDIAATLRNPNPRAGVGDYTVRFFLYDTDGQLLREVSENTYILPGSLHYLPVINIVLPLGRSLGRVEVQMPVDPVFVRLPDSLDLPRFSVFLQDRSTRTNGNLAIDQQSGLITNNSAFDWQTVELTAVGLDSAGNVIATGKTFIGKLLVSEQREFTIEWPKPGQAISQVIASPRTNIFREENIVEILGDPGSLR